MSDRARLRIGHRVLADLEALPKPIQQAILPVSATSPSEESSPCQEGNKPGQPAREHD